MIYKSIKTFEDACNIKDIDPNNLPDVSAIATCYQQATIAQYKLMVIRDAITNDWKPDWNDYNEHKWYPLYNMETSSFARSGSGFDFYGGLADVTLSHVGDHLCYPSSEMSDYAGRQFIDLYRQLMR